MGQGKEPADPDRAAVGGDQPSAWGGLNGYLDASALVAAIADEPARRNVDDVVEACDLVSTSRITYVEARAGLASSRRSQRISRRGAARAKAELERRWIALDIVELTEGVSRAGAELAERHSLRSHDAIQLASALALEDPEVVVVALDSRLRRAASGAGLGVAP